MGEVEPTHARAGPHRKRLRNQHSDVSLHIEQTPERTLLRVIRTRRVAWGRPDPRYFSWMNSALLKFFFTAVTPLIAPAYAGIRRRLREAISDSFCHDRVVIIMLA